MFKSDYLRQSYRKNRCNLFDLAYSVKHDSIDGTSRGMFKSLRRYYMVSSRGASPVFNEPTDN